MTGMTPVFKRYSPGRVKTLELLKGISGEPGKPAFSIYLPPFGGTSPTESIAAEIPVSTRVRREIAGHISSSGTGLAVFRAGERGWVVVPPFPILEKQTADSIDVEGLLSLISRDYLIAVVLVRLGSFGIGVFRGEKLLNGKVGTGLVHGRHRQGGSSAHRFERHRDKQIERFMTRVCGHAREQIGPATGSLDYIVYGGARTTILTLQKKCPFLGKLEVPSLPPVLDIPDPRQPVLEAVIARAWSSRVTEWRED
ncbi:MAG: hypothetical protein A2Z29_04640 [Chloroflexi bacterium RBG_16_56_11]|nr:MAG: hypothetical protein A2Z29_04640 [Chloroflexi bacterium RBG_16_56_11]